METFFLLVAAAIFIFVAVILLLDLSDTPGEE